VASMAVDPVQDSDLVALDASRLFEPSITKIGFRKGTFLRGYMYDFIEAFAPHLSKDLVEKASLCHNKQEVAALFEGVDIPEH